MKLSKIRIKQHYLDIAKEMEMMENKPYQLNTDIKAESEVTVFKQSPQKQDYVVTEVVATHQATIETGTPPAEVFELTLIRKEKKIEENAARKKICKEKKPQVKAPSTENLCEICIKSFSNRANLLRHLREHQGRRFVCDYENCNSFFTQRSSLKLHILRHKGEKNFRCYLCEKAFSQHKSLECHLRVHSGERPFACDYCKRSFGQKSNLIRHFKSHEKPRKPKKFKCSLCEMFLSSKQSLRRHIFNRHSTETRNDVINVAVKQEPCDIKIKRDEPMISAS